MIALASPLSTWVMPSASIDALTSLPVATWRSRSGSASLVNLPLASSSKEFPDRIVRYRRDVHPFLFQFWIGVQERARRHACLVLGGQLLEQLLQPFPDDLGGLLLVYAVGRSRNG